MVSYLNGFLCLHHSNKVNCILFCPKLSAVLVNIKAPSFKYDGKAAYFMLPELFWLVPGRSCSLWLRTAPYINATCMMTSLLTLMNELKKTAIQNSIIPSVTFFCGQPEQSRWSLVCQKRVKWKLIGSSSANTGGQYQWEAITQIKYTAGGKWSWNSEAKKGGTWGEIQMEEADKHNNVSLM